ncbi:S1 family peptidase [Kribbella sp. NPDC056345]|uniref:S1 family peptidase n=1 Tax=Kribbella sp. NPDC056345 TaxID=3345789 RepID=UPI0035E2D99A
MRRVLAPLASLAVAASLMAVVVAPAQSAAASENTEGNAAIFGVAVRATPASTGTLQVTGTSGAALALDAATMQDLSTHAKSSGQELSALVAAHQGIHEFSAYTTRLEETSPDTFVRAGLPAPGEAPGNWIQFTAKPSAEVIAELARLPRNTEVRYGAPASSKELADLADKLTAALAARSDVIRSARTRYDHEQGVLRLQYAPVGGAQLSALDSVFRTALTAGTIEGQLPIDVVLERKDAPARVPEAVVEGGRALTWSNRAHCTAGFTAVRAGAKGVLTARHCNNVLEYRNVAGIISTNPTQTASTTIDLQFHRTNSGHSTNRQFRATGRTADGDRTVLEVANAPINSTVCHWGETTTWSCSSVADTDICDGSGSDRACGLDVTDDDVSAGGDSGGPWFFGATARGIHNGAADGAASYFTRISRVHQHLNATVLQN